MHRFKKIALVLGLAVSAVSIGQIVDGGDASARCRIIKGELQTGYINISPPCELDQLMFNGKLGGRTVAQRCADHGGTSLGTEYWWGAWHPVCYNIDY